MPHDCAIRAAAFAYRQHLHGYDAPRLLVSLAIRALHADCMSGHGIPPRPTQTGTTR